MSGDPTSVPWGGDERMAVTWRPVGGQLPVTHGSTQSSHTWYGLHVCHPQIPGEALILNVIILGDRAFQEVIKVKLGPMVGL